MAEVVLTGELRSTHGKGAARKLRREDKLPAVLYGGKQQGGQPIIVDGTEMRRLLASGAPARLLKLDLGQGNQRTVLLKDLQYDPVKGTLLHADFHEVALDEAVQTAVPLVLAGEDARENDGGILDLLLREVAVSCLPADIPESITVDVSQLAIGDTVHVRDLVPPPGVELVDDPDTAVLTVAAPAVGADQAGGEEAGEDGGGAAEEGGNSDG